MALSMEKDCSVCGQTKELDASMSGPAICPACRETRRKEDRDAFILAITKPHVCSCGCSGAIAELAGRLWDLGQRLSQLRG